MSTRNRSQRRSATRDCSSVKEGETMKSLGDHGPVRPSGQTQTSGGNGDDRSAVVGNERLTVLAGAVLLVLIVVELVTVPTLRALLSVHVFIGVLLAGPLAAILVLPVAAPWSAWITTTGNGPGPFLLITGMLVVALALLAAQLLRWR